ncbi:hypothetical protein [Nevskia ramosa]|uniref:hypothetical protein n=1 Tax=Nevskia ramosa TaxID=64002 RepID=UPI002354BA08|nr:hypothetical protein [Nevskia ramosa]
MSHMTQYQMCLEASRKAHQVLQHCAWMAGLMGDNPNPLTRDEVDKLARSDKPYAWAFKVIVDGRSKPDHVNDAIQEAVAIDRLTDDDKRALYQAGKFAFPPPPVPHLDWSESHWIKYIDSKGRWLIHEDLRSAA